MNNKYLDLFNCTPEDFNTAAQEYIISLSASPQWCADLLCTAIDVENIVYNASLTVSERRCVLKLIHILGGNNDLHDI